MSRRAAGAGAAVGLALALLPSLRAVLGFPVFYLVFAYFLCFWIAQSTSWTILAGYTGYFSFGQGAFFGTGVYTSAVLVNRFGVDYFLTIPLAGLAATLVGLAVGGLAFRLRALRGEVFALLTLAVAYVLAAVARLSTFVDGGQGQSVPIPEYPAFLGDVPTLVYRLGLVVALGAVVASAAILHSRLGTALFAIRGDEDVAEGIGVPTFRAKMIAIAVSGFIGGASGGVHALQLGYVTVEDVFAVTLPLLVILMSVLGGRAHWAGPVLGAVVVYTLQDRLASAGFERWSAILLGGVLVAAVVFAPEGLWSRVRARPVNAVAVLAAVLAGFGLVNRWGGFIDWLAVALLGAAVAVFLPAPRLRRPHPPAAAAAEEQSRELVG